MSNKKSVIKTLKFIIKTDKRQEAILNKITARHTFAVREYCKLIEKEIDFIKPISYNADGRLDQLTITTKNRNSVFYDFKELTGLSTTTLQSCGRTALRMWRSYISKLNKWERRREKVIDLIITSMLMNLRLDSVDNIIINPEISNLIGDLINTKIWKKITKNKPSPPLTIRTKKPKKIPIYLFSGSDLLPYRDKNVRYYYLFKEGRLFVKISTLQKRQSEELELIISDYHISELQNCRLTCGKLYKNSKNQWEFHANIRKEINEKKVYHNKRVILGIDLGSRIDATVVALIENEKISQKRMFFFRESDLRKKKFNLTQRINVLQRIKATRKGKERENAKEELKALSCKVQNLTTNACHRISRKISLIVKEFTEQGYETRVVIGKLYGLRNIARKGNGKGKKYRGIINSLPFHKLTQFITYKCYEQGVKSVSTISESWTSKTCHKCGSQNTKRLTQASFQCLNCGLQYHADLNGAINIALRFIASNICKHCFSLNTKIVYKLGEIYCSNCKTITDLESNRKDNLERVKLIFLFGKSEEVSKLNRPLLTSQGSDYSPSRNELTGTTVQLKVEEARKREMCYTSFR